MIFQETKLKGSFIIEPEKQVDDRGFFSRSFCRREFEGEGLNPDFVQCNISFNRKKGTLRGMHYQASPYEEAKLVRCTRGAIYDVVVDLRKNSPTFKQWTAVEMNLDNLKMLYIPVGFAHGFQTLDENTEVFYQMSECFSPDHIRGVRWDDPAFGIEWPETDVRIISEKDRKYPDFAS